MAKKTKEKRSQLQMTDSKWEQSFIISHLPSFVEARVDSYEKGKEYARIGNWVGVRGDMQTINSLMIDSSAVEAFGTMTSAQASVLIPKISLSKVPSAFARSIYAQDPRSKGKPLPLQVELAFAEYASSATVDWHAKAGGGGIFSPSAQIRGAGVKDINIDMKFSAPGVNMSTVDITFSFDSMRTFAGNQRKGVGFLDLIPTDAAMVASNGLAETLWHLQLSVGWNVPDMAKSLFSTPRGKAAIMAIKESSHTWHLGYGGETSMNVKQDGSVELKVKYIPQSRARDMNGMNSGMRADVLGSTKSSTSGDYRQKLQELRDELKEKKKEITKLSDSFRKLKTERQQALDKAKQQEMKAQNAIMEKFYNDNPPEFAIMKNEGWKPPKGLNPDKPDDLKKIHASYAKWKASTQMSTIGTDLDFGAGDGPSLRDSFKAIKSKIKTATESFNNQLNKKRTDRDTAAKELQAIHAQIQALRDHPSRKGDMEDKYASFIRELFFRGHLHYLTLTAKEQKQAAHGARRVSTAHKWFTGKGGAPLSWAAKIKERVGNTGGTVAFEEQNLKEATAKEFNEAVKKALKNPPDTSKLLTSAISTAHPPIDADWDADAINDKRIYYFYLGDLMSVVMDNYYANLKNEETQGPEGKKETFNYDSLILSDFYYNTYPKDGKPRKKKPEETVVSKAYNLGDFPVSLSSFTKFFAERFVSSGTSAVPLEVLLEEMVVYLFGSESFTATNAQTWGPFLNPYLPSQRFDLSYDNFSTPVKLHRGVAQKFKVGGFYDTTSDLFRMGPHGVGWQVPPDRPNATGNGDGQLYNYFCLGADPAEASPSRPAFTIFLGTDTSFVKDVRYTQTKNNAHIVSEAITKGATSGNGLMKMGMNMMMYDVELTLMGAAFFKPGQCFELNNNIFGISSAEGDPLSAFDESLDDLLPRIVIVQEVNHHFDGGSFETKVKAMASGTTYKDFKEGRTGDLISNLPRPGTGNLRKGASGSGTGKLGQKKRPFSPGGGMKQL